MSKPKSKKPEPRRKLGWPVVEGIGLLAAQLGISEGVVKQLKRNGSKAFLTHNRIDTGILLPELFNHLSKGTELPEGIATPQDWLATEKAKHEAIRRQKSEGLMMPTADAVREAGEAMGQTFADLERMCRELPPALAGLSAVEIHKRIAIEIERMRKTLHAKFQQIGK